MLLLLGFAYISLVQWYRRRRRHQMYLGAIRHVVNTSSILVTRSSQALHHAMSITSPFLQTCRDGSFTRTLLEDDRLVLTSQTPQHTICLTSWTSYLDLDLDPSTDHLSHSVLMLLEASRPADLSAFLQRDALIPPVEKVHVLQHGCPIAWKPGAAFGIVLHCTPQDFVVMCDAFGQGRLVMGEELELQRISTIRTEGKPQRLLREQEGHENVQIPHGPVPARAEVKVAKARHPNPAVNGDLSPVAKRRDLRKSPETVKTAAVKHVNGSSSADNSSGDSDTVKRTKQSVKPPNILIYCGKVDSVRHFKNIKDVFEQCVNTDSYVIYHLKLDQVRTTPWVQNTALLVISFDHEFDGFEDIFLDYLMQGGRILSFGSSFEKQFVERKEVQKRPGLTQVSLAEWKDVNTIRGRYNYVDTDCRMDGCDVQVVARDTKYSDPVIVSVSTGGGTSTTGIAILSQLLLEKDPTEIAIDPETFTRLKRSNPLRLEILQHLVSLLGLDCSQQKLPDLTSCFLMTQTQELKQSFLSSIEGRLKDGCIRSRSLTLQFVSTLKDGMAASSALLPVVTSETDPVLTYFQPEVYWRQLQTAVLGRALLYTDVLPTTMTLFEGLQFSVPESVGLVAVAGRQTTGKGRGGNAWLSPEGCAMFSLHVRIPVSSLLGDRVSFLQHITSLAVVHSVTSMSGYEAVDLKLKWPNDIYYSNKIKLGGVIVNSTIMGPTIHAIIGCGFNVDNHNPTICINDLILQHNRQHGTNLQPCSTEQLIGRTVTLIEKMMSDFQTHGHKHFCEQYYKTWLHSDAVVRLESEGGKEVSVVGLDSYGYLEVRTQDGKTISVQPDGNSFDMMHNLISIKVR